MGRTATIESFLRALGKRFGSEPAPVVVALEENQDGI